METLLQVARTLKSTGLSNGQAALKIIDAFVTEVGANGAFATSLQQEVADAAGINVSHIRTGWLVYRAVRDGKAPKDVLNDIREGRVQASSAYARLKGDAQRAPRAKKEEEKEREGAPSSVVSPQTKAEPKASDERRYGRKFEVLREISFEVVRLITRIEAHQSAEEIARDPMFSLELREYAEILRALYDRSQEHIVFFSSRRD
jgi:ribosomal protein L12E/L44/L45/RPP1/RPP2